jgi:hypothetical protein
MLKKQAYLIEQFFRIKGKLEICNNSVAEFDTKFINITDFFTKSDSTRKAFIGLRYEFGNIDKSSIEIGYRIIENFEFPFKFGRITVHHFNE